MLPSEFAALFGLALVAAWILWGFLDTGGVPAELRSEHRVSWAIAIGCFALVVSLLNYFFDPGPLGSDSAFRSSLRQLQWRHGRERVVQGEIRSADVIQPRAPSSAVIQNPRA
jgi:hypothetical protein